MLDTCYNIVISVDKASARQKLLYDSAFEYRQGRLERSAKDFGD